MRIGGTVLPFPQSSKNHSSPAKSAKIIGLMNLAGEGRVGVEGSNPENVEYC